MSKESTLLGTVEAVAGSKVTVVLDDEAAFGLAFVSGVGYRVGQIGSFVRIPLGYQDLFGIVVSVGSTTTSELQEGLPRGRRSLTIELAGESDRGGDFRRGVSQFPTIGDQVHIVTEDDLVRIYGRPQDGRYVRIGSVASAESIPALIELNKLVTRHCAVIGSTGAGKSTTVATIIATVSDRSRYPSARILLLDIHGEYPSAFSGVASIFRVDANEQAGETKLYVPYWALNFDEIVTVAFGDFANDADRGIIRQRIEDRKRKTFEQAKYAGVSEENLNVDTPIPFSIHDMWLELHKLVYATYTVQGTAQSEDNVAYEVNGKGKPIERGDALKVVAPRYRGHTQAAGASKIYQAANSPNIRRQVDGLASKLRDPRFDFLFRPGAWMPDPSGAVKADLDKLIEGWLGGTNPMAVLDLSGIPSSILEVLVGALLRIIFDCLFWARNVSEGGRQRPLLIVMEEAHFYLGPGTNSRASHAAGRIVKEGRKYGIGAMIVSQRPSEIDPTILSQCGTIVALRLTNPSDRGIVMGSVSDNLEGLLATVPTLRTGEAIVIGEAVQLPMRTLVAAPPPNRRPDSKDPVVFTSDEQEGGWNSRLPPSDYADVITLWRRQDYRSERLLKEEKKKGK